MDQAESLLQRKIKTLSETVWEHKAQGPEIEAWLKNFDCPDDPMKTERERLNALYLLSNFMYFGSREIRELLRALYRDLIRTPIIHSIRQRNQNTIDMNFINTHFKDELRKTRFIAVGNPSESGTHLLYYFRQENKLPKKLFVNSYEIFSKNKTDIVKPDVKRYIFIDDFCGTGNQGTNYLADIVSDIKKLKPEAKTCYFVLFGTTSGLCNVVEKGGFDEVKCTLQIGESFKCFADDSRYFSEGINDNIDKAFAKSMCDKYGKRLTSDSPLGYGDCQVMIGFHHNTPNNTLPIFWYDDSPNKWKPIFKRYPKEYGW